MILKRADVMKAIDYKKIAAQRHPDGSTACISIQTVIWQTSRENIKKFTLCKPFDSLSNLQDLHI